MINVNVKNSIDSHQKMVGVLAPVGNQQPSPFRNSGKGSETIESNLSVNSIKDETRHMMKSELNPSGSMWPAPYLYDIDKDEDIVRPLVKTKAVYCDKINGGIWSAASKRKDFLVQSLPSTFNTLGGMKMNYCVYVHLDPRYPGRYEYGDGKYSFDYKPFYVGSGFSDFRPTNFKLDARNNDYREILIELKQNGLSPEVVVLKTELTKEESFKLEKVITEDIGIKRLGGPLVNRVYGNNVGGNGWLQSLPEEEREDVLNRRYRGENNPNYGNKNMPKGDDHWATKSSKEGTHPLLGKTRTQEFKDAMSNAMKGNTYGKGTKNGKFNSQDIIDYLNSINESVTLTPKDIEIHLPRLSIHINNSWWYIRKRLDQVTKYIGKSFDITATYGKNKTITINVTGVTNQ